MSGEPQAAAAGLFASLKTLSVTLVDMARTRLALLSVDVAEERQHFVTLLALALGALFCLGIGVLLLALLVVAAFWASHPLLALGGLAAVFLLAGIGVAGVVRHKLHTRLRMFEASLAELSKDRQQLMSGS